MQWTGWRSNGVVSAPAKIGACHVWQACPKLGVIGCMEVKAVPKPAVSNSRLLAHGLLAMLLLQTVACTTVSEPRAAARVPGQRPTQLAPSFAHWQHYPLPGKVATEFAVVQLDGREVVAASSEASASMLRQPVHVESADLGQIEFSWMVPQLIEEADMAVRQADDSPARVVLAFDGDRSKFSLKNAMLSELSHTITGEPLPYATLIYAWCNARPAGTVIINPRTDRIRTLVVESGTKGLGQWLGYGRNIRADFALAFGEPPGALVGLGLMTDTDNTQTKTRAWYGPLSLTAAQ